MGTLEWKVEITFIFFWGGYHAYMCSALRRTCFMTRSLYIGVPSSAIYSTSGNEDNANATVDIIIYRMQFQILSVILPLHVPSVFYVKLCSSVDLVFQGSFWGAILRDSRIFFFKIALILLRCENSRNTDVEATGIELGSLRVDFVLFQWNLRRNSVWVNDTFAFLIQFSEMTRDRLRASSSLCLRRKKSKCSVSGAFTAEFYRSSSPTYSYGYPTEKKSSSTPRASFYWNGEGRKLQTLFLFGRS